MRREPRCWGSELQQASSELLSELFSGLSIQTEPCVDRTVGLRVLLSNKTEGFLVHYPSDNIGKS